MSILSELWKYLRTRRKYWLIPIIIILIVFGALLMVAQSSAIAPFIYTLF
jgi:uncharacterized membrane protein YjdF